MSRMQLLEPVLRQDLAAFVEKTFTTVVGGEEFHDNWHIHAMTHQLERVLRGEVTRLIINVPPRHLKSITVSVAFPAFMLGHRPSTKIICASYNEELAIKHSTDTRVVLQSAWYRKLFPGVIAPQSKLTETQLTTSQQGFRYATSVGGTLTGLGGNLIIIDDPQKPSEAVSESGRKAVKEWFNTTLLSRLNNKAKDTIILVMQRLHEDDLTGHLLAQGGWEHLVIPAIAPQDVHYRIGPAAHHLFPAGSELDPLREPASILEEIRRAMGSSAFSAQYLQEPLPAEGNLFHWQWFKFYEPGNIDPRTFNFIFQSWDVASSISPTANYSVCTTWGVLGDRYYLVDVQRMQCEFPDLTRHAVALEQRYQPDLILVEATGIGEAFYQEVRMRLAHRVLSTRPKQDKQCRAEAVTAVLEQGRVYVPRNARWLNEFRREVTAFPSGRYDDQVDSMVQFIRNGETLIHRASFLEPRHVGGHDFTPPPTLNVRITAVGVPRRLAF